MTACFLHCKAAVFTLWGESFRSCHWSNLTDVLKKSLFHAHWRSWAPRQQPMGVQRPFVWEHLSFHSHTEQGQGSDHVSQDIRPGHEGADSEAWWHGWEEQGSGLLTLLPRRVLLGSRNPDWLTLSAFRARFLSGGGEGAVSLVTGAGPPWGPADSSPVAERLVVIHAWVSHPWQLHGCHCSQVCPLYLQCP